MKLKSRLGLATLVAASVIGIATESKAISLTGWSGVGNFGTSGADGVVTLSPFGDTQYGWVSTAGGVNGVGLPGVGGSGSPTNGSVVNSPVFSANAGDTLEFFFNYVTSDGAGFADYGWAQLLDAALNPVALLFTARTTPGGDTVPGFSMPTPAATLTPASIPIIGGAPTWSPLGASSGTCFDTGCGYTGWVQASYNILSSGNYILQLGTVNWNDGLFQSGLAFDGATIGGTVIGEPEVIPTPALIPGLLGLGAAALRKRNKNDESTEAQVALDSLFLPKYHVLSQQISLSLREVFY